MFLGKIHHTGRPLAVDLDTQDWSRRANGMQLCIPQAFQVGSGLAFRERVAIVERHAQLGFRSDDKGIGEHIQVVCG